MNKNNFIPIHPAVLQGLLGRTVSQEIAFTKYEQKMKMKEAIPLCTYNYLLNWYAVSLLA